MSNYMIVKTSFGTRKKKHYSIVLKKRVALTNIQVPSPSECINYNPESHLEKGEWFKIENIQESGIKNEILNDAFSAPSLNKIERDEFDFIDHMVIIQDDIYYFEKITSKHLISAPVVLLGANPSIKDTNKMIILDGRFDAIYDSLNDVLYFKAIEKLTSLFDGTTEYYKEATEAAVREFLENDSLDLHEDFDESKVSKPNRKRIGLLIEKIDSFDVPQKQIITNYVVEYAENMETNAAGNKLIIKNDEDLKHALMGFLERYFTTIVTQEAKIATGVMNI